MPYAYTDELTTSDSAFIAWGQDVGEMCMAACDALVNLMVADLTTVVPKERRLVDVHTQTVDTLVRECLQYILFYKDAEGLLLRLDYPAVHETAHGEWQLKTEAAGESIDPQRHQIGMDVKAITYHNFAVRKNDQGWQTSVVVDV